MGVGILVGGGETVVGGELGVGAAGVGVTLGAISAGGGCWDTTDAPLTRFISSTFLSH
jgi:hypothetical protein